MVTCLVDPLEFFGTLTGLMHCSGNLKSCLDVLSYSENKAHFDYGKINIYLLYFLFLTSSSTQFEEKHHFKICPEVKKTVF